MTLFPCPATKTSMSAALLLAVMILLLLSTPACKKTERSLSLSAGSYVEFYEGFGSRDISIRVSSGFSGAVMLEVAGLPAGMTATFTPASGSGTFSSILRLSPIGAGPKRGNYSAEIVATVGSEITRQALSISVSPNSFYINSPDTLDLGSTVEAEIVVAQTGNSHAQAVRVSLEDLPYAVPYSFVQADTMPPLKATLRMSDDSGMFSGIRYVNIRARSVGYEATRGLIIKAPEWKGFRTSYVMRRARMEFGSEIRIFATTNHSDKPDIRLIPQQGPWPTDTKPYIYGLNGDANLGVQVIYRPDPGDATNEYSIPEAPGNGALSYQIVGGSHQIRISYVQLMNGAGKTLTLDLNVSD